VTQTESKADDKKNADDLAGKKKKKAKISLEDVGINLSTFVPPDKHKFYVP
jgi:hypothetical protein